MVLPLRPMAMVELLHWRLAKIGGAPVAAIHLDNFNLVFGGNRPYKGCPLGAEFEAEYRESIRVLADYLHGRGILLQANNLAADQPGWDLPWDTLQLEYYTDFAGLSLLVQKADGRPVFVKSRDVDTAQKAGEVALAGAYLTSIWPGEQRPVEWFPKAPAQWR